MDTMKDEWTKPEPLSCIIPRSLTQEHRVSSSVRFPQLPAASQGPQLGDCDDAEGKTGD